MVLFLAALATALTLGYSVFFGHRSTGPRMAALDHVLKAGGPPAEVQKLAGPPSNVFEHGQTEAPMSTQKVAFWTPAPGQQVHRYGEEAMPCYFDVWLLIAKDSQKILDWRLFRLDEYPKS